ncbi:MAG: tetratricopeptide repeat protein [Bacteroidetes bacterium SW_9_63_38]|nr:MAG: tetratricopeptide repeat protein [Bacteroidetes bacterium SW_9_63_38]
MSADRLSQLESFYEDDPEDPFTRFALAQEHLKNDDVDEALSFFEELVETDPDYVGTYYHLGKLYERLGRTEEAITTYEQGIEVAREQKDQKNLSELQDAKLKAEGVGFE